MLVQISNVIVRSQWVEPLSLTGQIIGSVVLPSCYGNYKCGFSAVIYGTVIFAPRGNDKGGGEESWDTQNQCRRRTQCVIWVFT